MSDSGARTLRETMAERKARLLEEAAAIDREMAKIDELTAIAAKYGHVVSKDEHAPAAETIESLVERYRTHQDSPYQKLRHSTRENYDVLIKRILKDCATARLDDLNAPEITRLYESWKEHGFIATAHNLATMLRGLVNFGVNVLADSKCERLAVVLHNQRFPQAKSPRQQLTAEHAVAIIEKAHEVGHPEIALAQALQFECKFQQKDVIGEWVPKNDPDGESDVIDVDEKWLRGIQWSEIDADWTLRHVTSMGGNLIEKRLSEYPLVKAELERIGTLPTIGPVIINPDYDLPYRNYFFRRRWRKIANAAGVPKAVKNMDSRADARNPVTIARNRPPKSNGQPVPRATPAILSAEMQQEDFDLTRDTRH